MLEIRWSRRVYHIRFVDGGLRRHGGKLVSQEINKQPPKGLFVPEDFVM